MCLVSIKCYWAVFYMCLKSRNQYNHPTLQHTVAHKNKLKKGHEFWHLDIPLTRMNCSANVSLFVCVICVYISLSLSLVCMSLICVLKSKAVTTQPLHAHRKKKADEFWHLYTPPNFHGFPITIGMHHRSALHNCLHLSWMN